MRTMPIDAKIPLTLWRWRRADYDRLAGLGAFDGAPIELIGGHLVVAEPQSADHATAMRSVDRAISTVLPPEFIVRVQAPVPLDDESEPEPDLSVAPRCPDARRAHPERPVLIVEVADSSLAFHREHKGSLYARADIRDYWIVRRRTPWRRTGGATGPSRPWRRRPSPLLWASRPIRSPSPT
jgi:hypothetical protein